MIGPINSEGRERLAFVRQPSRFLCNQTTIVQGLNRTIAYRYTHLHRYSTTSLKSFDNFTSPNPSNFAPQTYLIRLCLTNSRKNQPISDSSYELPNCTSCNLCAGLLLKPQQQPKSYPDSSDSSNLSRCSTYQHHPPQLPVCQPDLKSLPGTEFHFICLSSLFCPSGSRAYNQRMSVYLKQADGDIGGTIGHQLMGYHHL